MAKKEHNERVNQVLEEAHVSEVAKEQAPEVTIPNRHLAKCEMVQEAVQVVCWPEEVQPIDECI